MPELISDTSPIQYLHQTGLLGLLSALYKHVSVPVAVAEEIDVGRALGINLPDVKALRDFTIKAIGVQRALEVDPNLGRGEREVLILALQTPNSLALLDDAVARKQARTLGIRFTGTLGVLLKAKQTRLLNEIGPVLKELERLEFRLDPRTRVAILKLADE